MKETKRMTDARKQCRMLQQWQWQNRGHFHPLLLLFKHEDVVKSLVFVTFFGRLQLLLPLTFWGQNLSCKLTLCFLIQILLHQQETEWRKSESLVGWVQTKIHQKMGIMLCSKRESIEIICAPCCFGNVCFVTDVPENQAVNHVWSVLLSRIGENDSLSPHVSNELQVACFACPCFSVILCSLHPKMTDEILPTAGYRS